MPKSILPAEFAKCQTQPNLPTVKQSDFTNYKLIDITSPPPAPQYNLNDEDMSLDKLKSMKIASLKSMAKRLGIPDGEKKQQLVVHIWEKLGKNDVSGSKDDSQ